MVAFSRLVSLISGVAVGLVLPKIFSIGDYGYFKIFTLYAVYTALLHFGFVDGLLLKLAGKNYSEIESRKMRTYTGFFMTLELTVAVIIILVGTAFLKDEYLFIAVMLALNMVFVNVTTYYQFISQATERFGEYSAKSIIVSSAKLVFVGILFLIYLFNVTEISYRVYLVGLNVLDACMMAWYIYIYRDITFGESANIRDLKEDIIGIFKTGVVLTVAYQVSHFILALDRQFVSVLFDNDIFAVYSFAYNIISLISTMISSLSVVLLPMLKKHSKDYVIKYYKKSVTVVCIVTSCALLCYYPLVPFIKWFLPNYVLSLEYIAVVLPSVLFTSVITVVIFTVVKVFDMSFAFFKDGCIVLLLGLSANFLAYVLYKSPKAISYASLIVMAIWFVISGMRLQKKIKVKIHKEFIYLVIISFGFLTVTGLVENYITGFLCYLVFFTVFTLIFFHRTISENTLKTIKKYFHN